MMSTPVPSRPLVYRHFHRIAWLAVALTFGVIVFGAFVRLSDAGLVGIECHYGSYDVEERAGLRTNVNVIVPCSATGVP